MWIFKEITIRYCKKIYEEYQLQADEKIYKGKEAGLLITRNDFARCLIQTLIQVEASNPEQYQTYFSTILLQISATLKELVNVVNDYNIDQKTNFTTDLCESLLIVGLTSMVQVVAEIFQKSPALIANITDSSVFSNSREVPWLHQLSYVLYDYILKKEFELVVEKGNRDIFDTKKLLVLKYIDRAVNLFNKCNQEDTPEYRGLMNTLLQGMRSDEHDLQQRRPVDAASTSSYGLGYFAQTFYKTTEKIMGKGQLGQEIEFLINEFNERNRLTQSLLN